MSGQYIADFIFGALGIILEVVPGLREWWENWEWQKAALLGAAVIVTAALVVLCAYGIDAGAGCVEPVWPDGAMAGLAAFAEALGFLLFGGGLGFGGRRVGRWARDRLRGY